jgi:hypothetical protein
MKIKEAMRYYHTPIKIPKIKNKNTRCLQECGEIESFVHYWWKYKMI